MKSNTEKATSSISLKILLGYLGVLAVTLIAAFSLIGANSSVQQRVAEFMEMTLPELVGLDEISSDLNSLELAAYSLYGTTTSVQQFDQQTAAASRALQANIDRLYALNAKLKLQPLEEALGPVSSGLDKLRQIMSASTVDWDAARSDLARLSQNTGEVRQRVQGLRDQISATAADSSEAIQADLAWALKMIVAVVVAIILVALVAYIYSRQQIAKPIQAFSRELGRMSDNRDLTLCLPQASSDEVGGAAASINQLVSVFRGGMSDVLAAIQGISVSVNTLGDATGHADATVSQLNSEIEKLVALTSALESQIEHSANRTTAASERAELGAVEVQQGAEQVESTSHSIATLASEIESTADRLLELRNAGDQVSSVVGTIAEIADQTNLLALNAAIEAARAGESGRGFAVVADEVRTLSIRTHKSTIEINEMLDKIVSSIVSSVDNMISNKENARHSVELAQGTVESLSAIRTTILHLSDECKEVSALAQASQGEVTSVRGQVDQFRELGQTVAEGSDKTQQAAVSLKQLSGSLNDVASKFRV